MIRNLNMLCIKTHGNFRMGVVYKCEYETILDSKYYRIFFNEKDYRFAEKFKEYCNLDYFGRVEKSQSLRYYKKLKLITLINKIFNLNINEYIKSTRIYNFGKLDNETYGRVYLKIIMPITNILSSEFYLYHQSKFHYIYSSILQVNSMKEHIDMDERLDTYEQLVQEIIESIKNQEEKVDEEGKNIVNPIISEYLDRQDLLFENWKNGLDEIWK